MTIEMILTPNSICDNSVDIYGAWKNGAVWTVIIHADSLLHLPVGTETVSAPLKTGQAKANLSLYPNVLFNKPSLEDITFLLPPNDPAAWDTAIKLAFDLGGKSNAANLERSPVLLHALYNNALGDKTFLAQKNVIVIGQNDGLGDLNQTSSLLINAYDNPVTYGVLAGSSLGYVDFMPSTWNNAYNLLLVRGNTEEGVKLAGDALTQVKYRQYLTGSSLMTNGSQIIVTKP